MEAGIDSQDILLLQWLYAGQQTEHANWHPTMLYFTSISEAILFRFTENLIPIYGASITSLSLRHALLVFSGIVTSGSFGPREDENSRRSRHALMNKSIATFDEGDLFASFLLAFTSLNPAIPALAEFKIHLNGCGAIMRYLSSRNHERNDLYNVLRRFWPMVRDLLLNAALYHGVFDSDFIQFYILCKQLLGAPTLRQRSMYIDDSMALYNNIAFHHFVLSGVLRMALANETDDLPYAVISTIADVKVDLENMHTTIDEAQKLSKVLLNSPRVRCAQSKPLLRPFSITAYASF